MFGCFFWGGRWMDNSKLAVMVTQNNEEWSLR